MRPLCLPATGLSNRSTRGPRSRAQCLHTIAASWIGSAQNGHVFIAMSVSSYLVYEQHQGGRDDIKSRSSVTSACAARESVLRAALTIPAIFACIARAVPNTRRGMQRFLDVGRSADQ